MKLFLLLSIFSGCLLASEPTLERAKQLKAFLSTEKPVFEKRESERLGILEELDQVNQNQNQVRNRIAEILANRQELQMALDNLSMEVVKHRSVETAQQNRFYQLMKVVNKIRRDGPIRFAFSGGDLNEVASRVRVLFHTIRMHSLISDQIKERSQRLKESEQKLSEAREGVHFLLKEMQEQESLLKGFLERKKQVLVQLTKKQDRYRSAASEWVLVSKELNELFQSLEADRGQPRRPAVQRYSLGLPLTAGKIVRTFGRDVHPKFGTVTFHKGVEIEAEQSTPVQAVLDGVVEFEGWVRGLGNVLILSHPSGLYSLHAHLQKALLAQGAPVKKGEPIGLVGDTGNNEKPSLYFELRENGKAVDPTRYFSQAALKSLQG